MKVVIISVLVVANLAAFGIWWALRTGDDILATADTNADVVEVLDEPTGESLTFLIVGSDSRAGLDDLTYFGSAGGSRGDVVILVRLDSTTSSAQMLSLPRDLYVEIPGHGANKINAAYAFGGPSLLVETIRENLDVEVNHYIEVDFVGFAALIDELGGIEIAFPYPARDLSSGLDVNSGPQRLDGDMALAYARSRKYQEYQDGKWVSVRANDIGRTARQQEVIRAIVNELKQPSTILEAGQVVEALARYVTIDARLAASSSGAIAWEFKSILTGSVDGATLPSLTRTVDGASVQLAVEPEASEMIARFKSGLSIAEGPLRVQVLNGNGVGGSASAMSRTLESLGFRVESIGNADNQAHATTIVIVPQGSDSGDLIVSALGFGVVEFGDVDKDYDAIVVVGFDAS